MGQFEIAVVSESPIFHVLLQIASGLPVIHPQLNFEDHGNTVWELRWEDESADSMDSISTSRLCKSQAAVGGAIDEISSRLIVFDYRNTRPRVRQ